MTVAWPSVGAAEEGVFEIGLKEELTGLVLDRLDVKEKSTKISEQEGIYLLSWEAPSRGVGLRATQGAVW